MSRGRARTYCYATHSAVPANYYCEDEERYVGDYSESDGWSNGPRLKQNGDVTEIYRRKSVENSTNDRYHGQDAYMPSPPEYYYEPAAAAPAPESHIRRTPMPPQYRQRLPSMDERARYYPTEVPANNNYDSMLYRSSPQIPKGQANSPPVVPSAALVRPAVRRHPVTVRTPRYFRRTPGSTLYKRPSTLCLPLGCQPDPAVYRRPRKVPQEDPYGQQQQQQIVYSLPTPVLTRRPSASAPPAQLIRTQNKPTVNSGGDMNLSTPTLDKMLTSYEKKCGELQSNCNKRGAPVKTKKSKTKISTHLMKPKVPSSIRMKQEEQELKKNADSKLAINAENQSVSSKNVQELAVETVTTEMLDKMLSELMQNGCENKIDENRKNEMKADVMTLLQEQKPSEHILQSRTSSKLTTNSFNYRDISENMSKQKIQIIPETSKSQFSQTPSKTLLSNDAFKFLPRPSMMTQCLNRPTASMSDTAKKSCGTCICVDENSPLELHKSKSYIISLIDRALSKELGTIPEEKHISDEYPTMDPRIAIGMMEKHVAAKKNKEFCYELTQALNDSMAPCTAVASRKNSNAEVACACNTPGDEPPYVKKLKQLRWGHLKHIQREVGRLADLERYLDSFTEE